MGGRKRYLWKGNLAFLRNLEDFQQRKNKVDVAFQKFHTGYIE